MAGSKRKIRKKVLEFTVKKMPSADRAEREGVATTSSYTYPNPRTGDLEVSAVWHERNSTTSSRRGETWHPECQDLAL
jgi:hypothetical protein